MVYRVLVDDVRSFADGRDCVVARDFDSAVELLSQGQHIDELWLDFVLGGMESVSDVLFELRRNGVRLSVGQVFIHSSALGIADLLSSTLVGLGVDKSAISVVEARHYF